MPTRYEKICEVVRKIKELDEVVRLVATLPPGTTPGEMAKAYFELAPSEHVVWGVYKNQPSSTKRSRFELRCHCCSELLSQSTARGVAVFSRRTDGSRYPCIIAICDDPACEDRIVASATSGGGP